MSTIISCSWHSRSEYCADDWKSWIFLSICIVYLLLCCVENKEILNPESCGIILINFCFPRYSDVIMSTMASQITSLTIVYLTVYSGGDQRNIKAPRHWPLRGEFTGDRWIPRTNGQLRGKCFHLTTLSCRSLLVKGATGEALLALREHVLHASRAVTILSIFKPMVGNAG